MDPEIRPVVLGCESHGDVEFEEDGVVERFEGREVELGGIREGGDGQGDVCYWHCGSGCLTGC